jgi:hypothetical protein
MGNSCRQDPIPNWLLIRAESNVNEKFSSQAIPANDSRELSVEHAGPLQLNMPNEKVVRLTMPEL